MNKPCFDYSKLRGRITEKFGTQKAFAKELGIDKGTLTSKLVGHTNFTQKEIMKSISILEIDPSQLTLYFFKPRVEKLEQ